MELSDLQNLSVKDLNALCTSLSKAIQGTLHHVYTVSTYNDHSTLTMMMSLKLNCKHLLHVSTSDLSSELVGRLQVRDQLRTEQDAMLLEVQDLTSL